MTTTINFDKEQAEITRLESLLTLVGCADRVQRAKAARSSVPGAATIDYKGTLTTLLEHVRHRVNRDLPDVERARLKAELRDLEEEVLLLESAVSVTRAALEACRPYDIIDSMFTITYALNTLAQRYSELLASDAFMDAARVAASHDEGRASES